MAYDYTNYYGIGFPQKGSRISSEQEEKKARIIENQLMAANRLADCVVMREGEYFIEDNGGVFSLRLLAFGVNPAVMGLIRGGLCMTHSTISWDGIKPGYVYYCYLEWTSEMYENHEKFNTVVTTVEKDNRDRNYLLMAVFDTTNKEPILDAKPKNKFYLKSLLEHPGLTENPHGPDMKVDKIRADEIEVKELTCDGVKVKFGENGETLAKDFSAEKLSANSFYYDGTEIRFTNADEKELKTKSKTIIGAINELCALVDAYIKENEK